MASRSARHCSTERRGSAHERSCQAASKQDRKPRAQPLPVGQNGCRGQTADVRTAAGVRRQMSEVRTAPGDTWQGSDQKSYQLPESDGRCQSSERLPESDGRCERSE